MEGFSNQIKNERMVSSSYNSEQLRISLKKSGTGTDTHTCRHTHTCIPTSQTNAMLRETRCALAEQAWYENTSKHNKYEQNY